MFLPLATASGQTFAGTSPNSTTYEPVEEGGSNGQQGSDRFVASGSLNAHLAVTPLATFGPFRVLNPQRAALVAETDARSPRALAAMLKAFPGIIVLEMVECPGTEDDNANLRLGRMIRHAGIDTYVPAGGSVRSGAVELFLAGTHRRAESQAEFAVHSWKDDQGREPADFAPNDPVNQAYVTYYEEMGMSDDQAKAFYAMTNSVRNSAARWLTAADMKHYAAFD